MPRGPLTRLIGSAAGHIAEYNADRKQRKAAEEAQAAASGSNAQMQASDDDDHDDDELDEELLVSLDAVQQAQGGVGAQGQSDSAESDDQLIQSFVARHPSTAPPAYSPAKLPMPVVLPQRRPGSSHRGFIRAYAPVLQDRGVSQAAWLDFLDGLDRSIKNNPWFHVLNVAILGLSIAETATAGFSIVTHLAAAALHAGVEVSRRGFMNSKRNGYIDGLNDRFFKPRGLFCLIVSYKPTNSSSSSSAELIEDVDVETNIAKSVTQRDGQSGWKNLVKTSASTAKRPAEMLQPAPLVFPDLDSMDDQKRSNAIKTFMDSSRDYSDRTARANFAAQNPELAESQRGALPEDKGFASVYSDPNSAARTGGIVSLATAGKVNPKGPLARRRDAKNEARVERGEEPRAPLVQRRKERKERRPLKRMMKEGALYLMVVDLPSDAEVEQAVREMSLQES